MKIPISMTTMIGSGSEHVTALDQPQSSSRILKTEAGREKFSLSFGSGRAGLLGCGSGTLEALHVLSHVEKRTCRRQEWSQHTEEQRPEVEKENSESTVVSHSSCCGGHVLPFSSYRNCLFGLLAWTRFLSLVTGKPDQQADCWVDAHERKPQCGVRSVEYETGLSGLSLDLIV